MLLLLSIGFAQAGGPPAVHHAASKPCRNDAYPLVDGGRIIVCDKSQLPTLKFDPKSGAIQPLPKPHRLHTEGTLQPTPRIGGQTATTSEVLVWETDGPGDDSDLWVQRTQVQERRGLDVGPGDQHHPVSSGDWLAWIDQGNIKLWNTQTDERELIEAKTGFLSPPALQDNTVCWEFRHIDDVDLRCSNGFRLERPGHQTHPLLVGTLLLFRENGFLMSVDTRSPSP